MKKYRPKIGDRFKAIHRDTDLAARHWPMECIGHRDNVVIARDSSITKNAREFDNHTWRYERLYPEKQKAKA